ncbi:hypothetical protein K1719_037783 [Acacia pycnantha]|nr:hypothetical protein K1719_037783 [Acacia pycnantha]
MAIVLKEKKSSALVPSSHEEDDLISRSSKKLKNDNGARMEEEWPRLGHTEKKHKEVTRSFADILQGINQSDENGEEQNALSRGMLSDDPLSESEEDDSEPLCVITEDKDRNFPAFAFSEKMKKRLYKAWENAVIVKLLGRNIGYKILLSILQSLWARRGVIRLINIGNGYFVVKLTNKDDYHHALTGGPWVLFDHYLTMARTIRWNTRAPWALPCLWSLRHHADHCNSGKKREEAIVEQDQEVEGVVNGPNVPVEDKNKEQDVWRIVQKPRRRRNENKSKEAFDPNSTSGSRFEVLIGDKEKEESRLGGKQVADTGGMEGEIRSEVAGLGDSRRRDGDGVVQLRRKNGGKSSRKIKGKQGRKEVVSENRQETQRIEKRSRDYIQRGKVGSTREEKDVEEDNINCDSVGQMSEQERGIDGHLGPAVPVNLEFSDPIDMEPLIIPNPDILPNVTTPLDPGEDGPFVDPGPANALVEPGPASALVGKFCDCE